MSAVTGKAWVFGDEVNSDVMAPGIYFKESMEVMASHCLEAIDPDFAPNVKPGDIVVAGRAFGVGSAREQAALSFAHMKVGAILAKSYARIFYRNMLNFGVPALIFPEADEINAKDEITVDAIAGTIENKTTGKNYSVSPIPEHLMEMISLGGLMPYLKKKIDAGELKTGAMPT
ncbi:MAG: 3-isopropylmalate dehydratase [Rhodospirillaceae bacterium]|jgi:3-isopropylmalate/(R)-2-methylmalate dehydratase small subunit|nr:3-isopropylmalate dehydratase [Rhodospirillaceae bacterium]MBT5242240.1 3-isopropylmalate dehydratase [Rhodospirillaceae bacterium]MBT5565968.1 3-isopropylmalate dehydratase [Rhodospirillaceae bacterium]MBT6088612.1 3-isopropylmalate dehydratase [Rhodospirillaceae bacterium]MBT6961283.1 3-isopropylmalate dehydratase [Rhodospirillaceae bacterium]